MSDQNFPGHGASSTRSHSNLLKILLGVGIPIIILVGFAGYAFYQWTFGTGRSLDGVVTPVIIGMDSGDYEAVLDAFSGGKKNRDEEMATTRSFGEQLKAILGEYRSKKLVHVSRENNKSGATITLSYDAVFENDKARVTFVLKKRGEEWKVTEFNYSSPLIDKAMESQSGLESGGESP